MAMAEGAEDNEQQGESAARENASPMAEEQNAADVHAHESQQPVDHLLYNSGGPTPPKMLRSTIKDSNGGAESVETDASATTITSNAEAIDADGHRGYTADHERDFYVRNAPLRGSSSTFLASLTSASNFSSPITSPYPSSDSLRSFPPTKDPSSINIITMRPAGGRPLESRPQDTLEPTKIRHDPAVPASSPSSSSTSTQATTTVRRDDLPDHLDPPPSTTPQDVPTRHQLQKSSARNINVQQNSHTSLSPSRSYRRHPFMAGFSSADHTPTESADPFSSPSRREKSEEESEEAYNRTPLLQPVEFPEPKETHKLIKESDASGSKYINDYEVFHRLGSGAHGTVKLGQNIGTGQKVAIKIVRRYPKKGRLGKQESPEDKVKKEIAVLKKARHPHVVSLLEVIDDPEYGKVYLILEYVERGEIIWRKQTDKQLSIFEMHRARREIAGNINEDFEEIELTRINHVLWEKHLEKEREARTLTMEFGLEDPVDQMHLVTVSRYPDFHDSRREEGNERDHSSTREEATRPFSTTNEEVSNANITGDIVGGSSSANSIHSMNISAENSLSGSMYGSYADDSAWPQENNVSFATIMAGLGHDSTEWTPEEEEYKYVPCLTLSEARDVFKDTVLGLEYLHFHGVIHRDIKPANLLWTHGYRIKISDFGVSYLSKATEEGKEPEQPDVLAAGDPAELAKTVGTPAFYAPELCSPDLFDTEKCAVRPQITGQIDVWALGVTLYAMIYGRLPFFDKNEFAMYEKIAWHEVFIPSKRLKGVEDVPRVPMNSNKREDYVAEYELVDDELRDLLKRLLHKDPTQRITLKEVKHHPWILRGVTDRTAWLDSTDPSLKGKVKKIEISSEDVQDAVANLSVMDRFRSGIRRFASVVRGRDSRKRGESSTKERATSTRSSSRTSHRNRESRRFSLRGDEFISALRASRDSTTEHPLSQSTLVSPLTEEDPSDFITPIPHLDPRTATSSASPSQAIQRPGSTGRTTSVADSIMTIRASMSSRAGESGVLARAGPENTYPSVADSAGSSSSSFSRLLGGTRDAGRRLASRVRSREPGRSSRDNSSLSSRASSADNLSSQFEDHHVSPSLALSPATAAGHFNPPAVLQEAPYVEPSSSNPWTTTRQSSAESLRRPLSRQLTETIARRRANTTNYYPSSPEGQAFPLQRQPSPYDAAGIWSSEDPPTSEISEQFSITRSASAASRASSPPIVGPSLSDPPDPEPEAPRSLMATGETITPAVMWRHRAQGTQPPEPDDTGYNADGDNDNDEDGESDDEGIVMAGGERKRKR